MDEHTNRPLSWLGRLPPRGDTFKHMPGETQEKRETKRQRCGSVMPTHIARQGSVFPLHLPRLLWDVQSPPTPQVEPTNTAVPEIRRIWRRGNTESEPGHLMNGVNPHAEPG